MSSSATPWFLLCADGGAAMYDVFIDGNPIGTFRSDPFANVCINAATPCS